MRDARVGRARQRAQRGALGDGSDGVALALRGKKSVVLKMRLEADAADDVDAADTHRHAHACTHVHTPYLRNHARASHTWSDSAYWDPVLCALTSALHMSVSGV